MSTSPKESCEDSAGSALKVPFGLSMQDGRLYGPRDVARGKDCNCVCPGCKLPLIAKQPEAQNRIAHFAHAAGSACSTGLETAVHLAAKQIIEDERQIFLPAVVAQLEVRDRLGQLHARHKLIAPAARTHLDSVKAEAPLEGVRADILVNLASTGQTILVEIAVTHFVDDEKFHKLKEIGIPTLEFDLSEFRELSFDSLREALLEGKAPTDWVYHPEVLNLETAWHNELQPTLDAAKKQAEEDERVHFAALEAERQARQHEENLFRQRQSEEEARRKKTIHLELVKATNFKALSEREKQLLVAKSFKRRDLPQSLRLRVTGENSFGVSNPLIWQALLFRKLIQGCWDTGYLGFSKEYAVSTLGYRFNIKPAFPEAEHVAVWQYLRELENRGALRRDGKQYFKILVSGLDAYETLQLYRQGSISPDNGLAWVSKEAWPIADVSESLAHNRTTRFDSATSWQRVSRILPMNADSPVQDALTHYADLAEPAHLIEFWISAGYLVAQFGLTTT